MTTRGKFLLVGALLLAILIVATQSPITALGMLLGAAVAAHIIVRGVPRR